MKAVKNFCLFFIYSSLLLTLGFWGGVKAADFFYPGDRGMQAGNTEKRGTRKEGSGGDYADPEVSSVPEVSGQEEGRALEAAETSQRGETLSVETEYVLEEADVLRGTVVETVRRLPGKYVGMNRTQFVEAMETYESSPPLSELERGFVSLEVLSFARERVVVQMNYRYLQPGECYYLAVLDNEVVVYMEDKETVYISTGIRLDTLPQTVQADIIQMLYVGDEKTLFNFLETYSS